MATYTESILTADVTTDGGDTVIRFSGEVPIPSGLISVRNRDGAVTLTPVAAIEKRQKEWVAFLDDLSRRPADMDLMRERPMNRPPVEKNLFPDE